VRARRRRAAARVPARETPKTTVSAAASTPAATAWSASTATPRPTARTYDVRESDKQVVASCGGCCMKRRCEDCPPKEWTCA